MPKFAHIIIMSNKNENAEPCGRLLYFWLALSKTITFSLFMVSRNRTKAQGKSIRSKKNPSFLFLICRDRTHPRAKRIQREEGIDPENK